MHVITRYGVSLTPLKARILDLIRTHPGICCREINAIVFDGRVTLDTVKAHVGQIRDALVATDVTVIGHKTYGYRIYRHGGRG